MENLLYYRHSACVVHACPTYCMIRSIYEHISFSHFSLSLNRVYIILYLQTQEEFFQLYLSPVDDLDRIWGATVTHSVADSVDYSDSCDWRKEGLVTSVSYTDPI